MLNGALEFGRKTILGRKTTPLGAVNVVPARDGVQGRGVSHGGHASARNPIVMVRVEPVRASALPAHCGSFAIMTELTVSRSPQSRTGGIAPEPHWRDRRS